MADLWDPALKGKVVVLSEVQDTVGLVMLDQGVDVTGDFTADQFMNALTSSRNRFRTGRSNRSRATLQGRPDQRAGMGRHRMVRRHLPDQRRTGATSGTSHCRKAAARCGRTTSSSPTPPPTSPALRRSSTTTTTRRGSRSGGLGQPCARVKVPARNFAETTRTAQSEWIFLTPELLAQAQVFRDSPR